MAAKSTLESLGDLAQEDREAYKQDLMSVGITDPKLLSEVAIVGVDGKLVDILYDSLSAGENVLILGYSGFGKSAQVEQVAKELGMSIEVMTAATKLPEDFGGRPMGTSEKIPLRVLEAKAKKVVAERKARPELEKRVLDAAAAGKPLSEYDQAVLFKKLVSNVHITDAEISDALSAMPSEEAKRMLEVYAAPSWVHRILDRWHQFSKKTILFFDEVNQAMVGTLNALFQLIDKKRYADQDEYDMSEAVIIVAAGNFLRENTSLTSLSGPFIRRHPAIILNPMAWADSIAYLHKTYSHINPSIAAMILSIPLAAYQAELHSPARLEGKIKKLLSIIERQQPAKGSNPFNLDDGVVKKAFMKFYDALPFVKSGGSAYAAASSQIDEATSQMEKARDRWDAFLRKGAGILIDDATGKPLLDLTATPPTTVYSKGRAGSRELFKSNMRLLSQFKEIANDVDFWESLV